MGEIRCMSMGGEEIAALHVNVEHELLGSVRNRVAERLHIPVWKVKLVLPNGHVLAPSNDAMVLSDMLDTGTSSPVAPLLPLHRVSGTDTAQRAPHLGALWLVPDSQVVLPQCL